MNVMSSAQAAWGDRAAPGFDSPRKRGDPGPLPSWRWVPVPRRARLVDPRRTIDPGGWLRVRFPRTGMGPALALSSSFSSRVFQTDLAVDRSDRARRSSAIPVLPGRNSLRSGGSGSCSSTRSIAVGLGPGVHAGRLPAKRLMPVVSAPVVSTCRIPARRVGASGSTRRPVRTTPGPPDARSTTAQLPVHPIPTECRRARPIRQRGLHAHLAARARR